MAETSSQTEIRLLSAAFDEHRREDREYFTQHDERSDKLEAAVNRINLQLAEWIGQLSLAKWALGLGIPSIVGILLANLIRHWSTP